MDTAQNWKLFYKEELRANEQAISLLNEEFNAVHRLDKFDITISAAAGLLGAAVDILLVGIPHKTLMDLKQELCRIIYGNGLMKSFLKKKWKSSQTQVSKVPYDAQDNRSTTEYVNGLSAYYHRLLSLGHDPFLV